MATIPITELIPLDVVKVNSHLRVLAKQNDYESRFLSVKLTKSGADMVVPNTVKVLFGARRADGLAKAFYGSVNEDGMVSVKLPTWVLDVPGKCYCDIGLLENDSVLLSTMPFTLEVVEAACTDEAVEEEEDPGIIATIAGMKGEGLDAFKLGTDLLASGAYAFAQGHGEIIRDADSSSAGAYFDELEKVGAIDPGVREIKAGMAEGENSVALLNSIVNGQYGIGIGRGNYIDGKAATGIGYENIVNTQDGTAIGQRNFIRNFRSGFAIGAANVMNPDKNADGKTTAATGFAIGAYNSIHADSSTAIGIYNRIKHENVYAFGRRITSWGKGQMLIGFNPASAENTLFAIGDGSETAAHNFFHVYKNTSTGRALRIGIDSPAVVIGNSSTVSHENVFALGMGLDSKSTNQTLLGSFPATVPATLFAVGDGTSSSRHNLIHAVKNSTGRAMYMWLNTRTLVDGNVEAEGKMIAKVAPVDANDVVRLKELNELIARVENLEQGQSDEGYKLTFNTAQIFYTAFTLTIDGKSTVDGESCPGNTFIGTEFVFTAKNTYDEFMLYYSTNGGEEHTLGYSSSITLTLSGDATVTATYIH